MKNSKQATRIISSIDADLWARMKGCAYSLKPPEKMYEFVAKAIEERLVRLEGERG